MYNETTAQKEMIKKALIEIKYLKQQLDQARSRCEPIAVIGMGCRFPGGVDSPEGLWRALTSMQDLVGAVPTGRWPGGSVPDGDPYLQKAGFLKEDIEGFDYRLFRTSPREAERTDPQQRIMLKVCWEALENAGYAPNRQKGSKTGVYTGITMPDYMYELYRDRSTRSVLESDDVTGSGFSFLSGRVAHFFGFQGPAITVDTACSSSLVAVDQACKALWACDCSMALAGGVNLMYSLETTKLLAALDILSPDCTLRSFDANANGTVRGEGCGMVVLKRLADAERDQDEIYAVIRGIGVNQDGPSASLTAPYEPAQQALLAEVWRRCGVCSRDIGYLEAHGTGTALGDPIEISALQDILEQERNAPLYVGTVKSNIGHLEAAAGVAGLIKTVLTVRYGRIPGNLHFETPSPHIKWNKIPVCVPPRTLDWHVPDGSRRIAGVSSFGLSGTNVHAVVEQYCPVAAAVETSSGARGAAKQWPLKFSSVNQVGLCDQMEAMLTYLNTNDTTDFCMADLSYSQNIGKADLKERAVVWANSPQALNEALKEARAGGTNFAVSRSSARKKVVFLFTGQGSQYPAMLAELYHENAVFKTYMDECSRYYRQYTGQDLPTIIFSDGQQLQQTRYTQPALFAIEYSLANMYLQYGVEPQLMIGHSVGEYAAACLAGVFTLADAMKLISARGELMYRLPQTGCMAAVFAGRETVAALIADSDCISIAAANTAEQIVISGERCAIEAVCNLLRERGIRTVALTVSHAFHSPLMRPMLEAFEMVAQSISYAIPSRALLSNISGRAGGAEMASWQYWSRHILEEVQFYQSLRSLEHADTCVFVELGPYPALSGMAADILGGKADCLAANYPDINAVEQTERVLFELYVRGIDPLWRQYYNGRGFCKIAVPNYQFSEIKFGLDRAVTDLQLETVSASQCVAPAAQDTDAASASEVFIQDGLNGALLTEDGSLNIQAVKQYMRNTLAGVLKIPVEELEDEQNLLLYGLNSLTAMKLTAVWARVFHIALRPRQLLHHCTIKHWAELIIDQAAVLPTYVAEEAVLRALPDTRYDPFPLNEIQYAYWAGRNAELAWGGVSCCAYFEIDMPALDVVRFGHALQALVERHEMLRAVISDQGMQQIRRQIKLPFIIYRQAMLVNIQEHLAHIRAEMAAQVIPFGEVMFDVRLTEIDRGWRIHFGIDFMIADALSLYIFWQDLGCLYAGRQLEPLTVSYKDYLDYTVRCKQGASYAAAKAYWSSRSAEFPAAPALPTITVGTGGGKRKFVRRTKQLDAAVWRQFVQAAAEQNLTPSAALFSLYADVLSAWGGGSKFAVMLTVFQRDAVHPQINRVIGDFTQLALIEIRRESAAACVNAAALQMQMQADVEHSQYTAVDFVKLLNKMQDDNQMYPVVFTSALGVKDLEGAQQGHGFLDNIGWAVSSTPQVWIDHQVYNLRGGVMLSWDTLDDIFPTGMIEAMFDKYIQLIGQAATQAGFWLRTLTDLRSERQRQIQQSANAVCQTMPSVLLHTLIDAQIAAQPDKTAVVCDNREYSYRRLSQRAGQVSQLLEQHGIKKGDRIGLQMQKSFDQIAVVLGVVQLGAVYVPFMPDQPLARTVEIMQAADITVLFVDDRLHIGEGAAIQITPAQLDAASGRWQAAAIAPADLAYVIYTSGSTGHPKGVCISHGAAMNTILAVNKHLNVTGSDAILGVSALSFDLSVYDIFGLLSAGGTLVVPTEAERLDPKCWRRLSQRWRVTLWNSVPALMELYVDFILQGEKAWQDNCIRHIILSGDWIPLALFDKLKSALPLARLTSMGGATEASIWSNYYDVTAIQPGWRSIPYGRPLPNQAFYILDELGRPCPDWVQGRLHIAGKGLAQGYLNDGALTKKAFFEHQALKILLYDTGDYGRYQSDGVIEFLGRKDGQLKINGHRIEAGDIQAALKKCQAADDSVVLAIGGRMERKKLVVYIKAHSEQFCEADVKQALGALLPAYSVPDRLIAIDEFPMTANDKIDRKQLAADFTAQAAPRRSEMLGNAAPAGRRVLQTVREALQLPSLQPEDKLGDMGVSSVDIIRLANQLENVYTTRPSVSQLINYASVADLLAFYQEDGIVGKRQAEYRYDAQFQLFSPRQIEQLQELTVIEKEEERARFFKSSELGRKYAYASDCYQVPIDCQMDVVKDQLCFWNQDYKQFLPQAIERHAFQQFLAFCLPKIRNGGRQFNYVPADGRYLVQLYLSVSEDKVQGVAPGCYYLDVHEQRLVKLTPDERMQVGLDAVAHGNCPGDPAFVIHLLCRLDIVYRLYGAAALNLCLLEAGAIYQLLSVHAGLLDMGCRQLHVHGAEQLSATYYHLHSLGVGKIHYQQEKRRLEQVIAADKHYPDMAQLAAECRSQDIQLWNDHDKVKFKAPPNVVTPALRSALKKNKEHLMYYLKQCHADSGPEFPLTPLQMAYVVGRSGDYELGNTSAHYYAEFECCKLDPARFAHAVNQVIACHEALRTVIGHQGMQYVLPLVPSFQIPVHANADRPTLDAVRQRWSHHCYQLGQWPMFHIEISQLENAVSRLHVSFDCLIVDGWSAEIMLTEIFKAYDGKLVRQPGFTFREYVIQACMRQSEQNRRQGAEAYWQEKIKLLPPAPQLPFTKALRDIVQPQFRRLQFSLSGQQWQTLSAHIKQYRFTPSAVLCTAFMNILSQWSSCKDITLNLTVFNRLPLNQDVMRILGDFTNVALISFSGDSRHCFARQAQAVQTQLWEVIEHRDYNGLELLRKLARDVPGQAVMPVVFTSLLFGGENDFPSGLHEVYGISQTPQVVLDHQAYERNGTITLIWDFVEEAFEISVIEAMFDSYKRLLERLIQADDWNNLLAMSMMDETGGVQ